MRSPARRKTDVPGPEPSALRQLYLRLLALMDRGDYDSIAREISAFRGEAAAPALEALRRLISARIAIFKGEAPESVDWLRFSAPQEPWLEAEGYCILGVHRFHQGRDLEGSELFEEARKRFAALGMPDRETLSAYNAFIGRVNGGALANLSRQLSELQELERAFRAHPSLGNQHPGLLAMILRQKSYLFQQQDRPNAALELSMEALALYEGVGPLSDYYLTALQAADLCVDLGDETRARALIERIVPPLEIRVEFPLAYLHWRLGGPPPAPGNFEYASPYWIKKWKARSDPAAAAPTGGRELIWNLAAGRLTDTATGSGETLKASSQEGRLVRALTRSKRAKSFLQELLWPEQAGVEQLDSRLHRLVSRVNKRFGGLIVFDGSAYRLARPIRIE